MKLFVYRKGSGIIPGMVNVYGSLLKFLNIQPNSGLHVWFDIKRSEIKSLDKPSQRCDDSKPEPSVSKCVGKFIEERLNKCTPRLLMSTESLESCSQKHLGPSQSKHFDIISSIHTMDEREIFDLTGCMPGCSKSEFDLTTMMEYPNEDKKLSIYLSYSHGEYDLTEEYYIYDYVSFFADVGGYLGLLLGYSMWGMYHNFINWAHNYKLERCLQKKRKKESNI